MRANLHFLAAGIFMTGITAGFGQPALSIDPTFTKITAGPPVTDVGASAMAGWEDYDSDGYPDLLELV